MKVLSCTAARRQLEALHDGELPVADQIAVEAHVASCNPCASALADFQMTRDVLRGSVLGCAPLSDEECASLQASVVNRISAEDAVSLRASLREMFEDMHFVYAGLGAVTAVCLCAVITLGMLRSATGGGPGALVSVARSVTFSVMDRLGLATGSDTNPLSFGTSEVKLPRSIDDNDFALASDQAGEAVMVFLTLIKRDGSVGKLEMIPDENGTEATPGSDEARLVENLTGAASRAKFEPASREGMPVAVKDMVWVVAHTTVRASSEGLTTRPPNARRRSAAGHWVVTDETRLRALA